MRRAYGVQVCTCVRTHVRVFGKGEFVDRGVSIVGVGTYAERKEGTR